MTAPGWDLPDPDRMAEQDPSAWPADEAIVPASATPQRAPSSPGWWRAGVYASLVCSLIALAGGLLMFWLWRDRQREVALAPPVYSPALRVYLAYPHGWHLSAGNLALLSADPVATVVLADRAVQAGGPYEGARLVVAWQRIDPVTVFRVPRGCWGYLYVGPEGTFRCMERQGLLTPTYSVFDTPWSRGVSLAGTLPPARASYPMILLATEEHEWLAAIIVHWDGFAGARDLLARLALAARLQQTDIPPLGAFVQFRDNF